MKDAFLAKAKEYWTKDRLGKIVGEKKLLIRPDNSAYLLRCIGLLNSDTSMSADSVKKFLQINHMLTFVVPAIQDVAKNHQQIHVADLCCGSSFLGFALVSYAREQLGLNVTLRGIDQNQKLISKCLSIRDQLGFTNDMQFSCESVTPDILLGEQRTHLIIALHACDTASDAAIAAAIRGRCDYFAVAPCCQAELAKKWETAPIEKDFPFYSAFKTPQIRRELAAQFTDLMRLLIARANGYQVTATEFVASAHTNKNRLILGHRVGNYLDSAKAEYVALTKSLGGTEISLNDLITNNGVSPS